MARQMGPFYFTGTYNGMVGYKVGNDYFFRAIPDEITQTAATKLAAEDFGVASTCGKLIRQALHQSMDLKQEHRLTNRLNKVLAKVIRKDTAHLAGSRLVLPEHLSLLKGFAFNKETKLDTVLLGIEAEIEQTAFITVNIPIVSKIKRTKRTTHVEIKAIAISADFAGGTFKQTTSEAILIDVHQPWKPLELTMPRPGKETALVILQVRALEEVNGAKSVFEDKNYCAADIIAVLPPMPVIEMRSNSKPSLKKIPALLPTKHHYGKTTIPQLE
ncbi:hypothetical protein GFS24_13395 [Chitinophaga sp. SYP-B3965]|uniref:hypothetical protein n=1 Tax=Chitinophaga sp. SYP-B3965 TaxID=2663120 RepID=UPI001299CCED|nr:hypothetical protein [Chitinophaga sp. SYP-B3965]MRG46118.1 hypothetical protein [Chitinophaga sp. SYP-B3965]